MNLFGVDLGDLSLGDAGTAAAITSGLGLISGMTQPDPIVPYGQTEAAFTRNEALDREKMAQALQIAQMNAASAGAGGGAAIAAARIAQQTAFKQIREKAAADNLAAEMDYQRTASQTKQGAAQLGVQAAQNVGEQGRLGFQNAAQLLSAYKA